MDMMQAITAQAVHHFLSICTHIIDAAVFNAFHSSVSCWHETDLQCRVGIWIPADLHSVAVVGVIIGN